jgi:predicted nicotinamide N-methyase
MLAANIDALIRANTKIVSPSAIPEINLRLVTFDLPWWHSQPEDLENQGIVDPYWAFCWPGGTALARYLLDRPNLVRGQTVVDFGAGCGVVGVAAALVGAARAVACDIDPLALWACRENADLNKIHLDLEGRDLIGSELSGVDWLLVGDVTYSQDMVQRILPWFEALTRSGTKVLVADPGRGFLPKSLQAEVTLSLPPDLGEVPVASSLHVPIYLFSP